MSLTTWTSLSGHAQECQDWVRGYSFLHVSLPEGRGGGPWGGQGHRGEGGGALGRARAQRGGGVPEEGKGMNSCWLDSAIVNGGEELLKNIHLWGPGIIVHELDMS